MGGNTFGNLFRVTTFGESHGPAIGCVVDGCPSLIDLSEDDIQKDLNRRRPGQSSFTTQRKESDEVEILSGTFDGKTTGAPIALLIRNEDQRSKDYDDIRSKIRPGHADYVYLKKYGIRDHRGSGRASARETAARVAAGAIARKVLRQLSGVNIFGWMSEIGDIKADEFECDFIDKNPFFFPDSKKISHIESLINSLREEGNSIGARVNVQADCVPVGLGDPVFDRLDANIAKAMMSINAVKGVEIGSGFKSVKQRGTEHRDELSPTGFLSNNAGGIVGGISSGQDISISIALKPTSSIPTAGRSVNLKGESDTVRTKGRHDPCVGIRAVPIAEAMMALVLADHLLRQKAISKDISFGPHIPG